MALQAIEKLRKKQIVGQFVSILLYDLRAVILVFEPVFWFVWGRKCAV
jgi:hypothetical protein